jgi:hypothetical protein
MSQLSVRQMIAVLLAVMLLRPFPMQASSPTPVLGSIASYGTVKVGDTASPRANTLFVNDLVKTAEGSAVIQYKEGTRVLLAKDSSAQFTVSAIQLQKGQLNFRSSSGESPIFQADSLRLEPMAANSSGTVILQDGKASVSVTQGAIRAVDPTGVTLTEINAGQTQLFAMASPAAAAAASASASAAAPPALDPTTIWLLVLSAAITTATVTAFLLTDDEPPAFMSPITP